MTHSIACSSIKALVDVLVIEIFNAIFNRIAIMFGAPGDDDRYIVGVRRAVHDTFPMMLGFPMK